MKVCWGSCLSEPFCVSNSVRQGGVLSPVLFTVYLDGLLDELSSSGVGCSWGSMFVGAFYYADDIVLLAPCASALRSMLNICNLYAKSHGLMFNESKTQLICFRSSTTCRFLPVIKFNDVTVLFSDLVQHLGHILSYNLNDNAGIVRVLKDISGGSRTVIEGGSDLMLY